MVSARRDFEAPPAPEPAPYQPPAAPVNFERLHGAAIEHITKLEAQIAEYERTAKVVAMTQAPGQPVLALDDHGRIWERRLSPQPAGPGPQPMIWVQVPGPKV